MIKGLTTLGLPIWMPKSSDKKKYIRWCLNSIIEMTHSNFELIIINNQADKTSKKFIRSFKDKLKKNKHCKFFRVVYYKDNQGFTGAWETIVQKSQGENVCILNDDIILSEGWLGKMLKHLKGDTMAVGPTSNFVSGLQDVKNNHKNSYEEKVNYLVGFCLLIKKKALDDIYEKDEKGNGHYIDPRFYPGGSEELDVCIRLSKFGYDMVIARDVFVHHFGSRTLKFLKEYDEKNPMKFFNPRLKLLTEKHGRDYIGILNKFQKCPMFALGIPSIGQVDAMFLANFPWILYSGLSQFGLGNIITVVGPRNVTHLGRNAILETALRYGSSYLLFIDDDQIIPADIIKRLYNYKKDFITALAYIRKPPFSPAIYKGKDKEGKFVPYLKHHQGLVEVDCTGLPCTLIKMSVIKKLMRKKHKEIKKRGGLFYFSKFGEDINFTNELREMGVKIFADTDLVVGHLGQKEIITENTFENYQKQLAIQKGNK